MRKYTITFKPVDGNPPTVINRNAAAAVAAGSSFILYQDSNRNHLIALWPLATIDTVDSEPVPES